MSLLIKYNDTDNCTICMNSMDHNFYELKCNHIFCKDCINQLKKSDLQQKCPLCRGPLICNNKNEYIIDFEENNINNKKNNNKYIHFDDAKTCKKFMRKYKNVGASCCSGKGCVILGVSDTHEIKKIKQAFLKNK